MQTTNLELPELVEKLREFDAMKKDLVINCGQLTMIDGDIYIAASQGPDTKVNPTHWMHRQISDKLQIPFKYYEKMQKEYRSLLDDNVTAWFQKNKKNYLMRSYDLMGGEMQGRAFLSDSYKMIDHLDILMTTLQAVKEENLTDIVVNKADISETNLYVRFTNPKAEISAPEFLKTYRNPETLATNDGIISGFVLRNSETGQGSFQICPRAVILACQNGMIVNRDAYKRTHLGAKLEEGDIDWSAQTKDMNHGLIKSQIKDYVKHFSSKDYLEKLVSEITELGNRELEHPFQAVKNATVHCGITEAAQNDVLNFFTKGGDTKASGVAQAITYYAHKQEDADLRFSLEGLAMPVLSMMSQFDKPSNN